MEAAVEKRWSSCDGIRHGPILHWTARWRYALETLIFSAYNGLFGGATCGVSVWKGALTESTASVHYLHRVLD